ncbi:hypothetical protein [Rummeliibacillus pycnus]|uniref:hypothetical protein n=1 Tax=Rummeliibacillus pycnus TaxID=101070 RepID=UPI003D289288
MKKVIKSIFAVGLLSLVVANTNVIAAETSPTPLVETQSKIEVDKYSNEPIVPLESVKDRYAKEHIKLKKSDIPTFKELNDKVEKELNVSKTNPTQTIDLGNGFTVEASVEEVPNSATNSVSSGIQPLAEPIYTKTAKGSYTIRTLGVDQFRITVSAAFSYNGSKITSFQDPPSASAEAWLGWSGSITNRDIYSSDATAKDAIADADYKYLNMASNYAGHIEVRFTATGNYYMHDTWIGSAR